MKRLCAQNVQTILESAVNLVGSLQLLKEHEIFTLTSYNFRIYTLVP
jgi:hypothetical protein